jgi:hypothetical protein
MNSFSRTTLSLLAAVLTISTAHALELEADRPIYYGPAPGRERLDNCFTLGRNCGQDAADKFCRMEGMQRASKFELEKVSPTRTLTGKRCDGPHCTAFKYILCFTAGQRGRRLGYPVSID